MARKKLVSIKTITLLLLPVLPCGESGASGADLKALMNAARSVVDVQVDIGGMAAGPPQAAIDKSTGMILIARRVVGAKYEKTGAGVIVDRAGLIATNAHTVSHAGRIIVTFRGGTSAPAAVVKIDPAADLALLAITPPFPLEPLAFGDSDRVRFRESVYVIAHSPALRGSLAECPVTGFGKTPDGKSNTMLRLHIGLYKGDSGSPILSRDGKLLGLLAAGQTRVPSAFAIASNVVRRFCLDFAAEKQGSGAA